MDDITGYSEATLRAPAMNFSLNLKNTLPQEQEEVKPCTVIFTMFRRLHNQDEYGGGVGAGLTIAKKTIEHHGGHIWIKSQLDEGTKVFFSVPKKQ